MTGNRNAWRAPLAGLASVAMLATMGVAAGTAGAAEAATVSLNANNGQFTDQTTSKTLTDTYEDNTDGKFGLSALYETPVNLPTRAGYTFTGWYSSTAAGQAVDPESVVSGTLYAHWAADTEIANDTITFQDADTVADTASLWTGIDTFQSTVVVAAQDTPAAWQIPSKDLESNSTMLKGWSADGKAPAVTDFNAYKGKTLFPVSAEAVRVNYYDSKDAGSPSSTLINAADGKSLAATKVEKGTSFTAPTAYDTAANTIVKTWQYNDKDGNPVDFANGKVDAALNLFPKSTTAAYKLSITVKAFEADGKTDITPAPQYKDLPGAPTAPYALVPSASNAPVDLSNLKPFETLDGYTFNGWYLDEQLKTQPKTGVNAGQSLGITTGTAKTVYAKFTKVAKDVDVTFDLNYDGSTPIVVKAKEGSRITPPANPAREGFKFTGWATRAASGDFTVVDFATGDGLSAVSNNPVYYAQWQVVSYYELGVLLNLDNKLPLGSDRAYTEASFAAYDKVRDEIGKQAVADGTATKSSDDKYEVDLKADATKVEAYVKALNEAKAKLEYLAEGIAAFKDVDVNTPFYTEIKDIAANGITAGFPDGTFHPATGVNRQDFAAFLYRLAGSPDYTVSAEDNKFADVTASTPHYKEILWGAKNGIINGYTDGTFKGQDLVSRADAAAFLYRVAKNYGNDTAKKRAMDFDPSKYAGYFSDEASTAHKTEVMWAVAEGIVKGYPNGTFQGGNTILRQDAAAFISRTIDAMYTA